jgi:soluble lytic murein transglycosylase
MRTRSLLNNPKRQCHLWHCQKWYCQKWYWRIGIASIAGGALIGLLTWVGVTRVEGQSQRESAADRKGDEGALGQIPGLGDYARYQRALTHLAAQRPSEAEKAFREVTTSYPASLLNLSAALQAAELAWNRGAHRQAIEDLAPLVTRGDGAAIKRTAEFLALRNQREEAIALLRRLYFEFPQETEAEKVPTLLRTLGVSDVWQGAGEGKRGQQRAERLEAGGLWRSAGEAYRELWRRFPHEITEKMKLRGGICLYRGSAFAEAASVLGQVRTRSAEERAEVLYYLARAQLSLENEAAAVETLGKLREAVPKSDRVGDLLYAIGRALEGKNRNEGAATYYEQVVRQYPHSEEAHRAHLFLAWRAHQAGNHRMASELLTEHLAKYGQVTDQRGKVAFWAALNAERSGDKPKALTLYRGLLMRYGASWFGLNAERRIAKLSREGIKAAPLQPESILTQAVRAMQPIRITSESLTAEHRQRLSRAEQLRRLNFRQWAQGELEAARQDVPDSPLLNLRIAQLLQQAGENVAAIEVLRRAYPDYAQSLPDELPREAWEIFYPLAWWPEIQAEARRHKLDPYLVAGLIRQESVFNPRARSRANALGLMQLLPSTGQAVAKKNQLGGRQLSRMDFFNPILNLQLGTAYLAELTNRFPRFEYIAAAYNGGPTRVARWLNTQPAQEIEDWVEEIPLRETRLYVQGVYRNARHYQRLYDEQGKFRLTVPR